MARLNWEKAKDKKPTEDAGDGYPSVLVRGYRGRTEERRMAWTASKYPIRMITKVPVKKKVPFGIDKNGKLVGL